MSYIQSREAIEGVCRDKIACAAATPLPSVTGYPTSVKASSTPARAPSSCSCTDHPERGFKRRYSLSIETETECNSAKHISAHLIYVSEMSDSEDLSRNFAETDTETQVVLLPRNFDHIVAVQPRGYHDAGHNCTVPLGLFGAYGKSPCDYCLPAFQAPKRTSAPMGLLTHCKACCEGVNWWPYLVASASRLCLAITFSRPSTLRIRSREARSPYSNWTDGV